MTDAPGTPSPDKLRKAVSSEGEAVVIGVDATALVGESMRRLEAWPPAMMQLGRAMVASLLLQSLPDRNPDERLELQWRTDGPFGGLFVECRDQTHVRGSVLHAQAPVTDLKTNLGEGILQVRRIHKKPSTGVVPAQGDVTLDLLEYLERSEQKNCAMNLWIDLGWSEGGDRPGPVVRRAFGFLVHILPQPSEAKMDAALFRWDRHLTSLGPLSTWVFGPDPTSDMMSFVTGEFQPRVISELTPAFFCSCSEDRAERALALMANAERRESDVPAAALEDRAKVRCEFCGRTYLLANKAT